MERSEIQESFIEDEIPACVGMKNTKSSNHQER